MDLLSILPDFPIKHHEHILPSFENSHLSITDLLTLDPLQIAKQAKVPLADARRFKEHVIKALHQDVGFEEEEQGQGGSMSRETGPAAYTTESANEPSSFGKLDVSRWSSISTLDPVLDDALCGGIPTRYVTEITGERFTNI
jgi:DNA repair protein RAD57